LGSVIILPQNRFVTPDFVFPVRVLCDLFEERFQRKGAQETKEVTAEDAKHAEESFDRG
jgi:hypothetical protein